MLGRVRVPALVIQGEIDSLFPLGEADATAAAIAANGAPVKLVWSGSGHDGGPDESERLRGLTLACMLCGPLPDKAALHSLLNRIYDLNLTVLSVHCLTAGAAHHSEELR